MCQRSGVGRGDVGSVESLPVLCISAERILLKPVKNEASVENELRPSGFYNDLSDPRELHDLG